MKEAPPFKERIDPKIAGFDTKGGCVQEPRRFDKPLKISCPDARKGWTRSEVKHPKTTLQ